MKTIIAGSRSILDYDIVERAIIASGFVITEVVSGCAKGVDTLGEEYAKKHNIPIKPFEADWKDISNCPNPKVSKWGAYNPRAGRIRNEKMGDYADALICVWDGVSSGSKHMSNYMMSINKPTYIYKPFDTV